MTPVMAAAFIVLGCLYVWHESGRLIEGGMAEVTDPDEQAGDDWMALADACQDIRDANDSTLAEHFAEWDAQLADGGAA